MKALEVKRDLKYIVDAFRKFDAEAHEVYKKTPRNNTECYDAARTALARFAGVIDHFEEKYKLLKSKP
jgi:selenocysteine lyase/cysteine desulfurase